MEHIAFIEKTCPFCRQKVRTAPGGGNAKGDRVMSWHWVAIGVQCEGSGLPMHVAFERSREGAK